MAVTDGQAAAGSGLPEAESQDLPHSLGASSRVFDRHGTAIYLAVTLALLALFIAAARFLTLEADEANILLSAYHVFGVPLPKTAAIAYPTLTSGGVYPLIHGSLGMLTMSVGVHRAISIMMSMILIGAVFALLRAMNVSRAHAMAGTALFAATPGFLLVGSAAMAEVMAAILLVLGLAHWVNRGRRSAAGALIAGVLFGLACATRFNAVFILPAILLYALDFEQGWRRKALYPGLCIGAGLLVLGIGTQAYFLAAGAPSAAAAQVDMGNVTGATAGKGALDLIRYLMVANDLLPIWAIIGIAGAYLILGRRILRTRDRQLAGLLILGGGIGWIMWVSKAPIPHIRYLWPALPCIWLGGIIVGVSLVERLRNPSARMVFHSAVLATCFYQGLIGFYMITQSESLTLAYQLNRTSPLIARGANWGAAEDQRALGEVVRSLPPSAKLFTITRNAAFPITYLSGKAIEPLGAAGDSVGRPTYLLALPADFAIWRPSPELVAWRELYAIAAWRRGDFALYRIKEQAPAPPSVTGLIGLNDVYPELRPAPSTK